jgi:hypothetical protein
MTTTVPTGEPDSRKAPRSKPVDMAKKYWWVAAIAVPIAVAVIGVLPDLVGGSSGDTSISIGRIGNDLHITTNIELTDPAQRAQFEQAIAFAREGQYAQSRALFEQLAATTKSAGVLNNLGVVNAALGDDAAAQARLSEALQIDPANESAKANLGFVAKAAAIQAANNTILTAAPLQLGSSLDSSVTPDNPDFFTFTAPAIRDIITIRVENKSTTLMPDLFLYNGDRAQMNRQFQATAGANATLDVASTAAGNYYVQVAGFNGTSGAYTLTATPQKAFDRFEPNDTILEPREIPFAQDVEANVMDGSDSDVYRVSVPAGSLRVTLTNTSASLMPDVMVFDSNRVQVAREFQATPGSHNSVQATVNAAGIWYVRVNGFNGTSGAYRLRVGQ